MPDYGYHHRQLRKALLPYAYGKPCPRCHQPMLPGQPLDLGHTDNGHSYNGLEHARCNRADGADKTNRQRARTGHNPTSRRW